MKIFEWNFLVAAQFALVAAIPNCPLAGAEFPPPQTLAQHPAWQQALDAIRRRFDLIDNGGTRDLDGDLDDLSYSIQIFSTNPGGEVLAERHRTAPNLLRNTTGVKQIDKDTVYRLGSVSKIFTVVAWLAELGDVHWNHPITDFIPELADIVTQAGPGPFNTVRQTAWQDITIGALASQISGIGRDYGVMGEILETEGIPSSLQTLFPTLPPDARPPCGTWPICSRGEFFKGLRIMVPSYPPWQSATYSNIGFQLFVYALENITGKAFPDILNDKVIQPLALTNTYYEIAPAAIGIIPTTVRDSYWFVNLGDADPGGNMYSSTADLSTLGRAILSSQLMPAHVTRRWLQPASFSADFAASIGAPWGIRRIQLDQKRQPYRTLSVFTKAGTFRRYAAFVSLLKEFNIGITIMLAGAGKLNNFEIADMMGSALIPAYDAAAREEADVLFSGTYVGWNSSMVISTDPTKPGLGIVKWSKDGVDMLEFAVKMQSGAATPPVRPEIRLYYSQLEDGIVFGGKRQSWKAVFEDTGLPNYGLGLFSTECGAWVAVTGITYGSLPLDEFVFTFDGAGRVVNVINMAMRSTLWKVDPPPKFEV